MDESVVYYVKKLLSGCSVEGLTEVHCCEKCSESRFCYVKAFKSCLLHECEESVE